MLVMAGRYQHGYRVIRRVMLEAVSDAISADNLRPTRNLMIVVKLIASGSINANIRFNNDSAGNYSHRFSSNGAADTTAGSQTAIGLAGNSTNPIKEIIGFITNITA